MLLLGLWVRRGWRLWVRGWMVGGGWCLRSCGGGGRGLGSGLVCSVGLLWERELMENVYIWFCCLYGCYVEGSLCVFDNYFMCVVIKDRYVRFLLVFIDYYGMFIYFFWYILIIFWYFLGYFLKFIDYFLRGINYLLKFSDCFYIFFNYVLIFWSCFLIWFVYFERIKLFYLFLKVCLFFVFFVFVILVSLIRVLVLKFILLLNLVLLFLVDFFW